MEGKLLAVIALVLMMIEPLQGIQLTTQTVVGNLLFEQSTVYVLALLMLIAALVIWSFDTHKSSLFLNFLFITLNILPALYGQVLRVQHLSIKFQMSSSYINQLAKLWVK